MDKVFFMIGSILGGIGVARMILLLLHSVLMTEISTGGQHHSPNHPASIPTIC
jgi:hypothetical protein